MSAERPSANKRFLTWYEKASLTAGVGTFVLLGYTALLTAEDDAYTSEPTIEAVEASQNPYVENIMAVATAGVAFSVISFTYRWAARKPAGEPFWRQEFISPDSEYPYSRETQQWLDDRVVSLRTPQESE